jgi:hypothetical protein
MTTIPPGVKMPDDHKKPAAQLEAEGIAMTDVHWREHVFTVPADVEDFSVEAILLAEGGQAFKSLALILGPKQWAEFMKTKPTRRDGRDLNDAISKALGMGDSEN